MRIAWRRELEEGKGLRLSSGGGLPAYQLKMPGFCGFLQFDQAITSSGVTCLHFDGSQSKGRLEFHRNIVQLGSFGECISRKPFRTREILHGSSRIGVADGQRESDRHIVTLRC